ncbi:hypothetical protein OIU77_004812 [Salix suchowensis]|uniref:UBC core domain-containing protein n=1 Tax=Salix suchowensis TaxID=1278906 RepID=A0ABQ9AXW6_9ROSI|nr:hypothetical protein OIU77_004812 [Salix suchowensis]
MDAQAQVLMCHGKVDLDTKGKSKSVDDDAQQQDIKNASSSDLGNYTSVAGSLDSAYHPRDSTSGSTNSNNNNGSNSDMSYHDDDADGNDCDDYADGNDCDDLDEYLYYDDDEDDYLTIQSQFDNVDLPPGVEAPLPWLKEPALSSNMISNTSTSIIPNHSKSKITTTTPCLSENKQIASTSSPMFLAESSSNGEVEDSEEKSTMQKYRNFKQFDNVEDFSDHHYRGTSVSDLPPPKIWAKRIQDEWKSLEKDLPDTIFVRVYETRMELLRAVIAGPAGTPYHDGLFVFDCVFPPTYPNAPPMVYYYSGGLRLNPNLYECGKVCLSLLGTWSGKETEMWIPGKSTMLQVLVSIQALILNDKPFFNEPGYESSYVGAEGDKRSKKYNEEVFILSLKTMMYTLRRPPKHFEDLVIGHFHIHAHYILVACKAYADGAIVGSVTVKDGVADVDKADKSASGEFKATVKKMINALVTNFTRFGSIDCEQFRIDDR